MVGPGVDYYDSRNSLQTWNLYKTIRAITRTWIYVWHSVLPSEKHGAWTLQFEFDEMYFVAAWLNHMSRKSHISVHRCFLEGKEKSQACQKKWIYSIQVKMNGKHTTDSPYKTAGTPYYIHKNGSMSHKHPAEQESYSNIFQICHVDLPLRKPYPLTDKKNSW